MLEKNDIMYITTRLLNGSDTARALGITAQAVSQAKIRGRILDLDELSKISSYLKKKKSNAKVLNGEIEAFEKYLTKKQWEARK